MTSEPVDPNFAPNLAPHHSNDECRPYHCAWHEVDEPLEGYLLCGECFHIFVTEEELVEADYAMRSEARQRHRDVRDVQALDADTARVLQLLSPATPPALPGGRRAAENIYACPHCAHDF
jgi:hypothetical protein